MAAGKQSLEIKLDASSGPGVCSGTLAAHTDADQTTLMQLPLAAIALLLQ